MFDARARPWLRPAFDVAARPLERAGWSAASVTVLGLLVGLGACVAVALEQWWLGLGLMALNRYLDGVDGVLARRLGPTPQGGFLDFVADLAFYAAFVVAVAVAVPDARLACAVLLAAFYLNAGIWLTLSSVLEQRGVSPTDERSLRFVPGLVEGAETILAFAAFCVLPEHAEPIAWAFAGLVGLTVALRLVAARELLQER